MKSVKQIKVGQQISQRQQALIPELQSLVRDIERCEQSIHSLKAEIDEVNTKHANRKTTQDDIHYLEDVLACARKKLVWEKQMASLQKRTPALMLQLENLVNHPESSPDETTQKALMTSLQNIQSSMARLQTAKL